MRINGSSFDPIRPDRAQAPVPAPASDSSAGQPPAPVSPVSRTDSVEISSSGRSLAGRIEAEQRGTLDPERLAELRRKVYEGAYNTLDVVDQVARRILQRGDL
jgi:hypothetical protein